MEKELRERIARDCKRLMRESKKLIKRSREIFRYEIVSKRPKPTQANKSAFSRHQITSFEEIDPNQP